MEAFWSALIGVIVGALVTFGSSYQQNRWERRRAKKLTAETIAVSNRAALSRLAENMATDIAAFKADFADVYASGVNEEVTTVAESVAPKVSAAHDRALAITCLVLDTNVASKADGVYNAWYTMLSTISEDLMNEASVAGHKALVIEATSTAPAAFFNSVRAAVKRLDDNRLTTA